MHTIVHFFGQQSFAGISICAVFVGMLIRSMIRAFQRWEILPDPLLPAWLRRSL
jgi:hypothetical protein